MTEDRADERHNVAVNPSRPPSEGGREDVEASLAGQPAQARPDSPDEPGESQRSHESPASQLPPAVVDALRRIEASAALDRPGALVERAARAVTRPPAVHDALSGAWLGHALHPLMTDVPLGAWLSTTMIDLFGGRRARPAATGLLAFGVVTAVPTVASGLAEWLHADRASRRVGVVHAGANACALGLYTASLASRLRRGRSHGRSVLLALGGGAVAAVGGYLGGHLTLARKVGTRDERLAVPGDVTGSPT